MTTKVAEVGIQPKVKIKKRSQYADVWRRLKKSKTAVIGIAIILMFICMSLFANVIVDHDQAFKNERG